ncbi:hypothetical protein ISCGN_007269 [Ixodes scapularis]|uniref:Uncharacterized protein n=1 Tax=Ixodes scapularis TaxID=6945 RepID=B7PEM5_IXOSC|nr:hypothetical protein IscW_ISCW003805 [Ixodes scapularis]|eukprot:XP_002433647.1 hypothetical protein IscW_ISCW003805 [Ixodes scapularis]
MSSMTIVKPGSLFLYIIQKAVCKHESPQYPWFECREPSFSLNSMPGGIRSTDLAVTRVWISMQMMYEQCDPSLRKTDFVGVLLANDMSRETMFTIGSIHWRPYLSARLLSAC